MSALQILLIAVGGAALFAALVILLVAAKLYRFAIVRQKAAQTEEDGLPYERMMRKNKKEKYLPLVRAGVDWMRENRGSAEEVYISSYDGIKLHGALFSRADPRGAILLCHGFHSLGEADFGPVMGFYRDKGFVILLVDQRAHGRSEGKHLCFGVKERYDVRSWMRFLSGRFPDLPLFVSGVSMGCSSVLFAAQLPDLPENLRGVIADCGYDNPYEEVKWFVKNKFRLPARPFVPVADRICRVFAGFSLKNCSVSDSADRIGVPVLFFHGTKDAVVPIENAYKICAALKEKARFVIFEEALHGCAALEDRAKWEEEVGAFIENCLKTAKKSA